MRGPCPMESVGPLAFNSFCRKDIWLREGRAGWYQRAVLSGEAGWSAEVRGVGGVRSPYVVSPWRALVSGLLSPGTSCSHRAPLALIEVTTRAKSKGKKNIYARSGTVSQAAPFRAVQAQDSS